jgi:hypothetical protein
MAFFRAKMPARLYYICCHQTSCENAVANMELLMYELIE